MPVIHTHVSVPTTQEQRDTLKNLFGQAITAVPGKTENWLMCLFEDNVPMYFGGSDAPCLMADVCVFGKQSKESYVKMTAAVTELLSAECAVPADRIYVKYTEYDKWGWNGGNF